MTVCIRVTKFSILTFFIISLLLCIHIQLLASVDIGKETTIISRTESTDETNQTVTVDENKIQSHEPVLSDSKSKTTILQVLPIVDNQVPTTDNKSEEPSNELPSATIPSLIINNQTISSASAEQTPTTAPTTKKNLSSINSFEEWKQQQLHADLSKKSGTSDGNEGISSETLSVTNIPQLASTVTSSGKKGKLRKNFASATCGAKMLAHNAEAQNTGSILSSSPDEYMLNPCNAKIWFVIELCESIRILNIEIANFELFSSVPKTVRVSASDRYPTKDWHRYQLGTFNASFNRTIQSFQTLQSTTYLKYVKFELLEFHGHEHYCPLSVVRIHGSNVEDEIMTMEDNTNFNELKSFTNIPDENENDDDDNNDPSNDQQVGGIIGSAILDLAKRVFRRQTIRGTQATTTVPIPETNVLKNNCHRSVIDDPMAKTTMKSWHRNGTFNRCIARYLHGLWSKVDICIGFLSQICFNSNYCCQCPLKLNIHRTRFTLNFYRHPCGYYHVLTNQFVCKKEKTIRINETIAQQSTTFNRELIQDLNEKNLTTNKNTTVMNNEQNITPLTNHQSLPNPNATILNETSIQLEENRLNDSSFLVNILNEVKLMIEPIILSNTTNPNSSQTSSTESIKNDVNITEPSIDTNITNEAITNATSPPPINNNEAFPPIISSPWLKGMLVNTKSLPELFKIIEKLNFNLTLSNRYLQELSQHYVKKLDETQQTTDLLLNASKAADGQLKQYEEHLLKLQQNIDELSHRLVKLEAWIPLIICIIMCLFVWCVWSTCCLAQLRRSFQSSNRHSSKKSLESTDDEEEEGEDHPIICNGTTKRKFSTDSSDSNLSRSQRVPDLTLAKIKENGIDHGSHTIGHRSSHKTRRLLSLSTLQT